MDIFWSITWSVVPADCLISLGVLALCRECIVVVIRVSAIDIVIAVMSKLPSKAIAVLKIEPVCRFSRRGALCRGWKERVTLLVDGNSCR